MTARKISNATGTMTATIRRYVESHGEKVKGRLFRMTVPVNVRNGNDGNELGNRILFLPVTIPLEIRGTRKLLTAVHERTDFLKRARVAEWVGLAGSLLGAVPAPLQALVGPLASTLPLALCNVICTNIRGPDEPLYLLGHKMTEWYPYVPVGGQMTLNCAVLSYCGVTYFGFSGDVHAAPDMRKLEGLLEMSAAELLKASGVNRPTAKKTRRSLRAAKTNADQGSPPPDAAASSSGAQSDGESSLTNNDATPFSTAAD